MTLKNGLSVSEYGSLRRSLANFRVKEFVDAYKREGYRIADIDPLGTISVPEIPELLPQYHGLTDEDVGLAEDTSLDGLSSVRELSHHLSNSFCGPLGIDCSGIRDKARREWLLSRMSEQYRSQGISSEERAALLRRLVTAEEWERYVQQHYPMAKRFSLEGCESLLPLMDTLVDRASFYKLDKFLIAMPHRGRLNLLVNLMQFPATDIFAYFNYAKGSPEAAQSADLPYHLGHSSIKAAAHGEIGLFLAYNPSHLESVTPVILGMTRAYEDSRRQAGPAAASVVIHGDAAFCGQGVVMESLKLAQHPGYSVDGTIHVIVNNQIGFTTPNPLDPENHSYCTDIARIVSAPVLHVNADHPEAVVSAARIAFDYRMQFKADVVIDLVGYRRWGHAEQDTATVTQPLLHGFIEKHPSVTAIYAQQAEAELEDAAALIEQARSDAHKGFEHRQPAAADGAAPVAAAAESKAIHGLGLDDFRMFVEKMTDVPSGFVCHEAIEKLIAQWRATVADANAPASWNFTENMAYASLLSRGHKVRISGMDVQRGTFMHRHAVWHSPDSEQGTQTAFCPLNQVASPDNPLTIVNSPLSEEAVVGFEYGFSVNAGRHDLVIWEAQFGDFVNGAQIMIDQYITSGGGKWGYESALTMLLPHGYEGIGPEHSTGYLSRILLLCGENNIRVAYPSSSAQWFHLLRKQAMDDAKPLFVITPKSVLYGEQRSFSPLSALMHDRFHAVVPEREQLDAAGVKRVALSSGKVFYDLLSARTQAGDSATALLSLEQLYPFPTDELRSELARYEGLEEVIWVQEEEKRQGAWLCVREHIEQCLPPGVVLRNVCRKETAAGPTASKTAHQVQQQQLMREVFPPSA